jgi:hypothetical protein
MRRKFSKRKKNRFFPLSLSLSSLSIASRFPPSSFFSLSTFAFHFKAAMNLSGNAVTSKYSAELIENAAKLVRAGRGILAADESTGTIGKRVSFLFFDKFRHGPLRLKECRDLEFACISV